MISQPTSENLCLTNINHNFSIPHNHIHPKTAYCKHGSNCIHSATFIRVNPRGGYAYAPASQRFRHFVRSMDGPPLVCISTISARLEVKDLSLCLSVMSTSSPCIRTSSGGMCWVCWRGSNACLVELLYWQAIVTASCNRSK